MRNENVKRSKRKKTAVKKLSYLSVLVRSGNGRRRGRKHDDREQVYVDSEGNCEHGERQNRVRYTRVNAARVVRRTRRRRLRTDG